MGKWIYGTQNIFMDGKPKRQGCYLIWQKYGIRSAERNPWRQLDEGLSLKEQLAKVVLEVLQWLNSSKTKGISPKAASQLDGQANPIINAIDGSPLLGRYKLCFRFDGIALGVNQLSTGCKTVLNVLYYPDKVFCLKECGNNALEILLLRRLNIAPDCAEQIFLCKAEDWAVASATAIDDNAAEGDLGK